MKKTIYLISGLILLIIIILLSVFLASHKKENNQLQQVNETPTSIPIPTSINNTPLQITNIDPIDKRTTVPVNQIITITFNKTISKKDISFSIQPVAPFVANVANNQLLINFLSDLSPKTIYTYTITFRGNTLNHPYSFTTADATSAATNDNASQINANWSRANKPDLFLYNQIPYSTTNFSVTGDMTTTAPYHFYFIVTLRGTNQVQAKQEFIAWLISLGLTNDQIKTLDIQYQ